MSVLERLASSVGRRDEEPNRDVARQIVAGQDQAGVLELVAALDTRDSNLRSDALKALYEVGALDPFLIAPHTQRFVALLGERSNRMVWGAMMALAAVASQQADELFPQRNAVLKAMASGSVITVDAGVRALAGIASARDEYRTALVPELLRHLKTCRPKDVPQHSEAILPAVNAPHAAEFVAVLEKRLPNLTGSQAARVRKVMRRAQATRGTRTA